MQLHDRQLIAVAEALREYRPILPPGLATRAGFYQAIKRGHIPSVRMGRRIYVIRAKLESVLNGETVSTNPDASPKQ